MNHDEARARLQAERAEVADLLAGTESSAREDRETEDEDAQIYDSDAAPDLAAEGMDDAIAESMRNRLDAIDRALKRLDEGTYGLSVRSGAPIPDDRLEADPAAELTVEEARAAT
jgi:DnaK suppressor protein